jgi:hypothetical protein
MGTSDLQQFVLVLVSRRIHGVDYNMRARLGQEQATGGVRDCMTPNLFTCVGCVKALPFKKLTSNFKIFKF